MLDGDFIAGSANISTLDPDAEGFPIVQTCQENVGMSVVMSNSFGFGGTNSTLVFRSMNRDNT